MSHRVPYAVAADAGREAFARARSAGCSLEEHVVLEAVVSLTALDCKLNEAVAVAVIAERAGVHPKNAAKALGRLRDLGVITYTAGLGRGNVSHVGLPPVETAAVKAPVNESAKESLEQDNSSLQPEIEREPQDGARIESPTEPDPAPDPTSAPASMRDRAEWSQEELLAEQILADFNARASTAYRFEDWGGQVLQRIAERPEWTLENWTDAIRRSFAVAWWEKKLPAGEAPTPRVIFSSIRQVDATMSVPDRIVEQAESRRRAVGR